MINKLAQQNKNTEIRVTSSFVIIKSEIPTGSELFNSVFNSPFQRYGEDNQQMIRSKRIEDITSCSSPPLTGNYIHPLADLFFLESVRPSGVIIKDWGSDDDEDIFQSNDVQTIVKPSFKKIEFTKARNEPVKSDKQVVKPRMVTQSPKVDRKDWNGKMTQKLGLGFVFTKKACFICGSHNHLIKDCDFHEKRMPEASVLEVAIIGKSGRIPVSTAKLPFYKSTVLNTRVSKEKVNTARQRAVSTVKGYGVTAVKALAGCGNPQQALKYKGMFDSGCSRHMTGNKALLTDYQDIDGGFVTFGGSTRGGNWKSIIKRYIDTKPNSELIHYCLQNPPYMYQWTEKTVPVAEASSKTTIERYMENYKNVSQDIRDQLNAEAEAVQIILTGIDNDIYSTVDACPNACEMWKAIERLKQGESINVQDLETNLY
ncbi:hypothetical protein Tco_0788895 [Tanacetum coccineum]